MLRLELGWLKSKRFISCYTCTVCYTEMTVIWITMFVLHT